ncbi:hypothetical protein QFZ42_003329 [Variovorax paradoxus]|nr:hypothetical protein [Variovorax paradoxus]
MKFSEEDRAQHRRIHPACIPAYADSQEAKAQRKAEKQARMAAKVERAIDRQRRVEQKRIPDLVREAQTAFNAFIRERDRDQPCICCGQPLGTGSVGGAFDCGHYRSVGSASHLRFDVRNAHAQRKHCNRYGAGRAVDYRIGLIARIGLSAVEALEASNVPHKWERDELIAIKAMYVQKLKELRKEQA